VLLFSFFILLFILAFRDRLASLGGGFGWRMLLSVYVHAIILAGSLSTPIFDIFSQNRKKARKAMGL